MNRQLNKVLKANIPVISAVTNMKAVMGEKVTGRESEGQGWCSLSHAVGYMSMLRWLKFSEFHSYDLCYVNFSLCMLFFNKSSLQGQGKKQIYLNPTLSFA